MGLNQTLGKVQEQGTTNLGIRLNIPANKLEEIRGILNSPDFEKSVEELDKKIEAMKNKIPVAVEGKESKETFTKSLEFEEDTFKIDSKGWRKEKRCVSGGKSIKVKVNATGDVVEYLEGPAKGEQIFITYDAFIREVMKDKNCSKKEVEKKYLMTVAELKEKMKDKPTLSEEYKKFFNKEVKCHLAGNWCPDDKAFYDIEFRSLVWLAGGSNANFAQNGWSRSNDNRGLGFSGRLLKN